MQIHHIVFTIIISALLASAAPVEIRACVDKSTTCSGQGMCSNPLWKAACPKTCGTC
ncbi:hypothetical protein BDD12DRAFT_848090 [Trichophaea hybrida]|nr:hypothetical protein BDD12DRAFT_856538 [Trichophaea hybrida]KAF8537131.1 hypothetical protein BDD12DRAFT_848090 [Trichophaea hybrida]